MIDLIIIGFACISLAAFAASSKEDNNYIQCDTEPCIESSKNEAPTRKMAKVYQ